MARAASRRRTKARRLAKPKRATARRPPKKKPALAPAARASAPDLFSAQGGMPNLAEPPPVDRSHGRSSVVELTWQEFDRQVHALARAAARSFRPQAVVGVAHGGVFVGGAVASALKADFYPVRITRRSRDHQVRSHPGIAEDMPKELKGLRVLLVDDIGGSGDSLEMAARLARTAGAAKLKTATLVSRPGGFAPDFTAYTSDAFFVFPWDYQDVVADARFDPDTAGA